MKQRLLAYIDSLSDPSLRATCETIPLYPEFLVCPASLGHHHAYEGGLMAHAVDVCDIAMYNASQFPMGRVNRDVLLASALWHDVLKVREYVKVGGPGPHDSIDDEMPAAEWQHTDYGKAIGHIAGSAAQFTATAINYGVVRSTIDAVVHCILAHHGRKEWGSPVEPQTLEALILHQADMLSAKYGATKEVAP